MRTKTKKTIGMTKRQKKTTEPGAWLLSLKPNDDASCIRPRVVVCDSERGVQVDALTY